VQCLELVEGGGAAVAGGEEDRDAAGEAAGGEGERGRGLLVDEVRVVDEHDERRLRLEQLQQRDRCRHARARVRRDARHLASERTQERVERREGHVALGGRPGRAEHAQPAFLGLPGRVLQERGPADAGLAAEDERAAVVEQRADAAPLLLAPRQHGTSLGLAPRRGGPSWPAARGMVR
jgi:hypothetical protein